MYICFAMSYNYMSMLALICNCSCYLLCAVFLKELSFLEQEMTGKENILYKVGYAPQTYMHMYLYNCTHACAYICKRYTGQVL